MSSKDETSVLETEISRLQSEIEARVNQPKPDLNTSPAPEILNGAGSRLNYIEEICNPTYHAQYRRQTTTVRNQNTTTQNTT
ncbi:unnamed protein product [Brassica napus]|uniref:(rape) hypothetical protein n=1 Tax=Brassica napus TaxID=3708 RepID=A0A816UMY6_BRANA|nr:unnamed protein product [Brassica napus]